MFNFYLCLLISTAPYAAHWCIIRIIQKYFVAQGSFCKMLPECFQLVWKLGSPPPQAECPAVFLCIPYFGHPTSPSPNLKAKTMRRFQVLNILPCFLLRTNPTVRKYITNAPKWKYNVFPKWSLTIHYRTQVRSWPCLVSPSLTESVMFLLNFA